MLHHPTGSASALRHTKGPALLTAIGLLALSGPAVAQAKITQVGATTGLNCYNFEVTNPENERKLTDIHFRFPKSRPSHMAAPAGWDATLGPGGRLVFVTPPSAPPTGSTIAKNPVDPGKTLEGFRFCLLKLEEGVRISLTFEKGPAVPAGVFQGKTEGSTIVRNAQVYCATLRVTAPEGTAVSDIHFGKSASSIASPHFDDISAPGWNVDAVDDQVTLDVGKGASIAPGKTKDIDVCTRTKNAKIDWYLTDKDHKQIPGAKGMLGIK
jgi:hypothetical protein